MSSHYQLLALASAVNRKGMRLLSNYSLTHSASQIGFLFRTKERDTEACKRLTLQKEKSLSYGFDKLQKFLKKRNMNGENDLATHVTFCFERKNACVSPSEGITVKDCDRNKLVVKDAFESDIYPFEVILKCYDENTSEIREIKCTDIGLSIESYTNSLVNKIENLISFLEFDIPRKEAMSK